MASKIDGMVERLTSRYELTTMERYAIAQLLIGLVEENQTLKDRINVLSWQVNSDRQGGV